MKTTADRIKEGMEIRGLKQSDLVELTGISKGALSSYISGRYIPKQNNTYLIAKALNVNEAWIMGFDVPMHRKKSIPEVPLETVPVDSGVIIPVLGRVCAGNGRELFEDPIDTIEISPKMAQKGNHFGLVVKGDSMTPLLSDGDIVVVNQDADTESGDLVVALVNGSDAVCKRIQRYSEGFALIPENPIYEPMRYTSEDIDNIPVKIIGKIVESRRKY